MVITPLNTIDDTIGEKPTTVELQGVEYDVRKIPSNLLRLINVVIQYVPIIKSEHIDRYRHTDHTDNPRHTDRHTDRTEGLRGVATKHYNSHTDSYH